MSRIAEFPSITGALSRRNALKSVAGVVAGAALPAVAAAGSQTKVAQLWAERAPTAAECARLRARYEECWGVCKMLAPDIPDGLLYPNPRFGNFLHNGINHALDRNGEYVRIYPLKNLREFIVGKGYLKAFDDAGNPIETLWPELHAAIGVAKELLPLAEQHAAETAKAHALSGEADAYGAYIEMEDRVEVFNTAVLDAPAQEIGDFHLKAKVIRSLIDNGHDAGSESEDFAKQILEFFEKA